MTESIFKGAAKRLDDVDLPRIGHDIGVGEDELHAFMDVEAAGTGFDAQGRVKTLFEPHVFYRELGPGPERDRAVALGLAYKNWRPGAYPKDSYPRILKAMAINRTAALRSASWGLGQIMGFNHLAAGYGTVELMVQDFAADEDNHLEAMVRFLKSKKLDDDLRAHRWDVIERIYNGGGHNGAYARKMAERFAFWQRKPDTPWSPSDKYVGADDAPPPVTKPDNAAKAAGVIAALVAAAAAVWAWLGDKIAMWMQ